VVSVRSLDSRTSMGGAAVAGGAPDAGGVADGVGDWLSLCGGAVELAPGCCGGGVTARASAPRAFTRAIVSALTASAGCVARLMRRG
jgi:hypothetical protein